MHTHRLDPILELCMRRNPYFMPVLHEALPQGDIRLHIPPRPNRQERKMKRLRRAERQERRARRREHNRRQRLRCRLRRRARLRLGREHAARGLEFLEDERVAVPRARRGGLALREPVARLLDLRVEKLLERVSLLCAPEFEEELLVPPDDDHEPVLAEPEGLVFLGREQVPRGYHHLTCHGYSG